MPTSFQSHLLPPQLPPLHLFQYPGLWFICGRCGGGGGCVKTGMRLCEGEKENVGGADFKDEEERMAEAEERARRRADMKSTSTNKNRMIFSFDGLERSMMTIEFCPHMRTSHPVQCSALQLWLQSKVRGERTHYAHAAAMDSESPVLSTRTSKSMSITSCSRSQD